MNRIKVYNGRENGKLALGVKVADKKATIADLLAAWEPLADEPGTGKRYSSAGGICKGCFNNCCNSAYVIPDLVSFKALCGVFGLEPQGFLQSFADRQGLLCGLPRLRSGPCVFLNDGICTVYRERSLLCRFYLCTDILGETEELLYGVATAGIAATCIWLERNEWIPGAGSETGFDRTLRRLIDNYREHPGTVAFLKADGYEDVSLKHFMPPVSP